MNALPKMTFLWPELLWGLLLVPLVVLLYVWLLRRRKKTALRYANLALVTPSTHCNAPARFATGASPIFVAGASPRSATWRVS